MTVSPAALLTEAFFDIIRATEGELRDGTQETPERAARAWRELTEGYDTDISSLFTVFDGEGYDLPIAVRDVPFTSLCEHHLMPFTGTASVVYLPDGKIIGLSKIPRLVRAYSRRLQNQERMTTQIADALHENLRSRGVLVWVEAHHTCMSARGIASQGAMVTSAVLGAMREQAATRDEALRMIGR